MTNWIVRWSLRFRLLVLALAAGLLGFGIFNLTRMEVDNLPEFAPPHVQIQTEALGLSAAEVEQLITSPMEADLLNGVAWLDEIRSVSAPGLSSIELVFEPGTDLLSARQLVAERLTQAYALPNVSTPPVLMQPLSSTSRVMMVQLTSTTVTPLDMSVLARWNIKPVLMGIPGVANVSIWGQREQQLQVQVDPDQLRARGVTLEQVVRTTGNAVWVSPLSFLEASTPGTGGFLETANQRIGIQHVLPIRTPEDLGKVRIEDTSKPLVLSDVAQLKTDHQPLIGDAVVGGAPGLLLVIEKFPDTDVRELTARIDHALDELKAGLPGIQVDSTVFRPAAFLDNTVQSLGIALLLELLLVSAFIGVALRSWRYALIGLVAIALTALTAVTVLYLQDTIFNTMLFAGLALALAVVVGDAIIDLHSLRLSLKSPPGSQLDRPQERLIVRALRLSRIPVLFAGLISALAVAPALFVPGVDGAFLKPMLLAYLLALLIASIVALTVTPALASLLLRPGRSQRPEPAALERLRSGYGRWLARTGSGRHWIAATVAAVVAVAAVAAIPLLAGGRPVVASVPDRTILVQWDAAAATAEPEMNRMMVKASAELRAVEGVQAVGGHVGRAITSDTSSDVNSGELWVTLRDGASFDNARKAVQEIMDGYPGLTNKVVTYPEQQMAAVRAAEERGFAVRVYGVDLAVMRQKAEEIRQILASTEGVVDPRVDVAMEQPVAEIEVDLAAAERYGIKPGDVRRAAATVLQGIEVGYLFEQQKVFQVVVKGSEQTRSSLTSVRELVINTPGGGHVRLDQVADVTIRPNQTVIQHDDTSRRVDVVADIEGRSLGAVTADIQEAIGRMQFPVEYHAEIPTQYGERQASGQLVGWLAAAAALGILILLQTVLGSWRLAALTFILLPVALLGGVVAALLTGGIGSLYSLAGFAAVLAIAVRDTVLLHGRYQKLQAASPQAPREDLMRQAARDRLVPVLLAAAGTALALLPLVLLGGLVGTGTVLPLAIIVWGGLVGSTLLTLVVLPLLFLRFGPTDRGGWEGSLLNPDEPEAQERQAV